MGERRNWNLYRLLDLRVPMDIIPLLVLLHLTFVGTEDSNQGLTEYCQWDYFNATCGVDEVIVMTSAHYGRIRVGRCVARDYGYVGCFINVLEYMDTMCSGRKECVFLVPDATLRAKKPCPKDFSSHFEASYECQKVETGGSGVCYPGSSTQYFNVTNTPGFLSSIVTSQTGHGSRDCPWIITVYPGQKINITLVDFSLHDANGGLSKGSDANEVHKHSGQKVVCHRYAVIRERETTRESIVCGGQQRQRTVYVSAGNTVEVHIMRHASSKHNAYFLLKYDAIGCPKIPPPAGGWVEYERDTLVIGCNHTREKPWYLRCNKNAWVGNMRNCSPSAVEIIAVDTEEPNIWGVLADDWSSPFGILIVTALGVALGLVIGVIMLTSVLFCLKRRRTMCIRRRAGTYRASAGTGDSEEERDERIEYCKRRSADELGADHMELVNLNSEGDYGAMWKSRPPSYNSNPATQDGHADDAPAPPPPTQHVIRTIRLTQPAADGVPNVRCDPTVGAKLAALSTFRPIDAHCYESPIIMRRQLSNGDVHEITIQPREVS